MRKILEDKDLGKIVLKKYIKSRHYTIRIRSGKITVSLPFSGTYQKAMELVEQHRHVLLTKIEETDLIPEISGVELNAMKKQALSYLPARLKELAALHNFNYNSVRISRSKSRWGSCSSKKTISLSLFLMKLPDHLIDYVLLHELCHTIEMNHGVKFWTLLDALCEGKSKQFRKELKSFAI